MTGWRIGWAAGPRELIRALDTLLSQSAGNACSVSQAAAAAALNGDQSLRRRERRHLPRSGATRPPRALNAIPGLACRVPEGAFYLYVNCAGLIGKTTPDGKTLATDGDVVLYLLERAGVAVVAGRGLWPLALLPPVDRDVARHPRRRRRPHRRAPSPTCAEGARP